MRTTTAGRAAALPVLVTREHLRAAGLDLDIALRAERAGRWAPVLPGAWLRSPAERTRGHRQAAAIALLGGAAALSGADACEQYGLRDVPDDGRVCVVVPHGVRRDLGPRVRVVRTTAVLDACRMAGLPWTLPARAVVDAAHGGSLRDVRGLVCAAVDDGWTGADDLAKLVEAGPRRGSAVLRRAVRDAAHGARSAPEAEAVDVLVAAVRRGQLPPFLLNPQLLVDGRCVTPDIWFVGTGLGAELDSVRHHGGQVALDRTLARHARAADQGITLVHRSPQRLRADPDGFVDELRARIAGCPAPPGVVVVPRGPLLPVPRH